MEEKKSVKIGLPIEWFVPEDIRSQYATNMVVQHTDQEFLISFFEIEQPILLGEAEEIKAKLEQRGKARATCLARFVLTPERMKHFVSILNENYDRFVKEIKNGAEK
jgi:hypothetical protein